MGDPEYGFENNPALILIAPVGMSVAPGEAESTASFRPFAHPHHGFLPSGRTHDMFVGAFGVHIGAFSDLVGRRGEEEGRDAGAVLTPAHVEVPLIVGAEGLHAPGDRMHGKGSKLGR